MSLATQPMTGEESCNTYRIPKPPKLAPLYDKAASTMGVSNSNAGQGLLPDIGVREDLLLTDPPAKCNFF